VDGTFKPLTSRALTVPLTLLVLRKGQVKTIDESEDLKPEALAQMKRELKLLQKRVLANIEKELQAASDKGKEERKKAFAEANELVACINADARRLHGDSAKVVGSAEELLGPGGLVDAAENGDANVVRTLLGAGADINYTKKGDGGKTALCWAAYEGHLEVLQVLIDAGADVDKAETENGNTPLSWAAYKGNLQVVKALVGAKANVNKAAYNGWTPLQVATRNNKTSVAKYLKSVGAR
jgi:ankyrin repeat protein